MRISVAATLLACASVQAASDPSPFILFSTAKLPSLPASQRDQLQSSSQVLAAAKDALSSCPTSRYVIISQPNIHANDIRGAETGCKMPNLCRVIAEEAVNTQYSVSAMVGQLPLEDVANEIKASCLDKGRSDVKFNEIRLPALPRDAEKRREALRDNDYKLGQLLKSPQNGGDYTVLFFSDPNEMRYEADFDQQLHMDLKRDSDPILIGRAPGVSDPRPLFEKYQFFTPGIFMGLIALLLILLILSAGLKSLASLEVSYGAFEKEMGPAAQKKQQ